MSVLHWFGMVWYGCCTAFCLLLRGCFFCLAHIVHDEEVPKSMQEYLHTTYFTAPIHYMPPTSDQYHHHSRAVVKAAVYSNGCAAMHAATPAVCSSVIPCFDGP